MGGEHLPDPTVEIPPVAVDGAAPGAGNSSSGAAPSARAKPRSKPARLGSTATSESRIACS